MNTKNFIIFNNERYYKNGTFYGITIYCNIYGECILPITDSEYFYIEEYVQNEIDNMPLIGRYGKISIHDFSY